MKARPLALEGTATHTTPQAQSPVQGPGSGVTAWSAGVHFRWVLETQPGSEVT